MPHLLWSACQARWYLHHLWLCCRCPEIYGASLNTQMRISALSDEDLRREMREHTAAIPAARHMFGLNASERGAKGGDQSTGRLPHIGSHHKSQGSDRTKSRT